MDIQNNNNRSSFSGKIGYVLSAAGASVGLEIYGGFRIWQQSTEEESFFWSIFCWHLHLDIR